MLTRLSDDDLGLLLLIRHFELSILELFSKGLLTGTTHTCLGQEYIPVALYSLTDDGDFIFSNHRGHGHYLSRYPEPAGLLAEIMGRQGAICRGVGGSQHLMRESFMSSGVQGQVIPVACGMALGFKRRSAGHLAVAHLGDGTWGEGVVYEALNLAQLWGLPVVFVVENNGIAQSTRTDRQLAGDIEGRAKAFGIAYERVATIDINEIRNRLGPALRRSRCEQVPTVIEFETVRVGPHSKGDDSRSSDELTIVQEKDWYKQYRRQFPEQFQRLDDEWHRQVQDVVADVSARPEVS